MFTTVCLDKTVHNTSSWLCRRFIEDHLCKPESLISGNRPGLKKITIIQDSSSEDDKCVPLMSQQSIHHWDELLSTNKVVRQWCWRWAGRDKTNVLVSWNDFSVKSLIRNGDLTQRIDAASVAIQTQHTVIKSLVRYPEFSYYPYGVERLCDGISHEQLRQTPCFWLWMDTFDSQRGYLLPPVYFYHVSDNNIISAGDVRQSATTPPLTSRYTHTSFFVEAMRYYLFHARDVKDEADTRFSLLLAPHVSYWWNINTHQICCSHLCSGLQRFLDLIVSFNYSIKYLSGSMSWVHFQAAVSFFAVRGPSGSNRSPHSNQEAADFFLLCWQENDPYWTREGSHTSTFNLLPLPADPRFIPAAF